MSSTVQAWRLVKHNRAATAFDGEGAFQFGGRWNSRGQRVVYASSTLSLALLEILVHIDPTGHVPELVAIPIELPRRLVEENAYSGMSTLDTALPWPLNETRRAGDVWLQASKKPALKIPSAIVPIESNYLINPMHRDFEQCRIGAPQTFNFDPRLLQL